MIIAIDMDGTIVDFKKKFRSAIKDLFSLEINEPYIDSRKVYESLPKEKKKSYKDHRELYAVLCGKGFFQSLEPFDGAIEGVNRLFDAGHEIIFLTKPLNWDRSAPEKAGWLKKYFPDKEYKVIMVDSVHAKRLINVDILIDDDKRVLSDDLSATVKMCIAQPWNIEVRKERLDIITANSMSEAADMIINEIFPLRQTVDSLWEKLWNAEYDGVAWDSESVSPIEITWSK